MSARSDYHINFFKPASDFMRTNIKLISIIMVIWAVAVFGFHGLLKAIETPTPEPAYLAYQEAWPAVMDGSATVAQKVALARTCLTLTGKYIELRGNPDIAALFSRLALELVPVEKQNDLIQAARAAAAEKTADTQWIGQAMELADAPLLSRMIPYTLMDPTRAAITEAMGVRIAGIMDNHLVHFRSVMTDTRVLGFPFHYFYTAVLLMIIFCLLCLLYCARIDKIMIHFGLENNEAKGQSS